MTWRLVAWSALVALLVVVAYWGRASEGKPDPLSLYRYSTAVGTVVLYAFILLIVLGIASFRRDLLALRVPRRLGRTIGAIGLGIVAIYVFQFAYGVLVDPGDEQGLTPERWRPDRAAEYVINGIVICTVVPLVEELTYRGVGFSLLRPFGRWFAIAAVGILFGLAHGLLLSFPILAVFGMIVAWVRDRTDSVFPGIVIHGVFNALALVAAVTVAG